MTDPNKPSLTYSEAGVDIDRGNRLVDHIRPIASRTKRKEVMGSIGGFGSLFDLTQSGYRQPVLVAGTDGVGTKLKLAVASGRHDTIGIDLVAMCVNDLVVQGAEPLFFLDYYASSRLDIDTATSVISGIGRGCELAGAALVGGESAEMPGMYAGEDYDLSGFCVGVVEKDAIIDGSKISAGDALVGLASSGAHSNGYSLVRRIIEVSAADLNTDLDGRPLIDVLLEPTRIYVKSLLGLIASLPVHALAHITGGGLLENIPRVLPDGLEARVDPSYWKQPAVFDWLQEAGNVPAMEMYRTFNCGIGMVAVVPADRADEAVAILEQAGEQAMVIGSIQPGNAQTTLIDNVT